MGASAADFRQDITGLRAIAVLAVTFYHIAYVFLPESGLFKGGFLGVDIFFVLSGFLMTKIIINGLDKGNFSLYTFYARRAKRICPALLVTVTVFTGLATLLFNEEAFLNTCRDGLRSLGFISNIWFARKTGYFDGEETERLFLHTWSLSVEWQFYLLYPLLLLLCTKLVSRQVMGLLILVLTAALGIFGCVYTIYNPISSYYLLPTRAYELLIGALAYFYPFSYFCGVVKSSDSLKVAQKNIAKVLECIGLSCILVSVFFVDSSNGWPNAWSVLPLLGTYLCIAADNKYTILRNIVFQKLGLWSYAIYLVHWPIIVLFGNFNYSNLSWELGLLILVSGVALHYGIERRRSFAWKFLACYLALAVGVQALIKVDLSFIRNDIVNFNFPAKSKGNDAEPLHIGNMEQPVEMILTGDSFARQYLGMLENSKIHAIALTMDGCASLSSFYTPTRHGSKDLSVKCRERYVRLLELAKQYPKVPIVWAQNWDIYIKSKRDSTLLDRQTHQRLKANIVELFEQDLPQIIADLAPTQNRVYFLSQPVAGDSKISPDLGRQCYPLLSMDNFLSRFFARYLDCREVVPLQDMENNIKVHNIIQEFVKTHNAAIQDPVVYFELYDAYCSSQGCRILALETNEPVFYDGRHLGEFGAEMLGTYIIDTLQLQEQRYKQPK